MNLPRWTAYLALGLLAVLAATAVPKRARSNSSIRPMAPVVAVPSEAPRVVVLGIDGMDPDILRDVMERHPEGMANFRRLAGMADGVQELGTSTPPQSPVAWSNFITGRRAGGHGVFDFIHRDPATGGILPSTVKSEAGGAVSVPFTDYAVPTGGSSASNRSGRAFWSLLEDEGIAADLYRVPINYPVEGSKGVSFPGMLTPALDSAYGMYTVYTTDPPNRTETSGGRFRAVRVRSGVVRDQLLGPVNSLRKDAAVATTPLTVYIDESTESCIVEVGDERIVMTAGQWSRFVPVTFSMLPMGAMDVGGMVRFKLKSLSPEFELYASPVNFDPTAPADVISAPESAATDLADSIGRYFTQGMAEEVSALKDRAFTDAEFMEQADLVYRERERMLDFALDRYVASEEGGLLFFYVSSVDLAMHMMWRHSDVEHPFHDAGIAGQDSSWWSGRAESTWREVIDDLYLKMDPFLGKVLDRVGDDATVIVMSDHGFAPYRRKFSLNTWLLEKGYLVLQPSREREKPEDDPSLVPVTVESAVDWSRTKAYGIGFNGLYLNLKGREAKGIVEPGAEADLLLQELKRDLELIDDRGARVVVAADIASEVYGGGERLAEAPDIIVGYASGYGNSDEATQGRVTHSVLTDNLGGTFNGSHLMHPSEVGGVLLANRPLLLEDPRLEDLTTTILRAYGVEPDPQMVGRNLIQAD